MSLLWTAVVLLSLTLKAVLTTKVLVIPSNVNSHLTNFGHLGSELADNGQTVLFLVPSNAKLSQHKTKNFDSRTYNVKRTTPFVNGKEFIDMEIQIAQTTSTAERSRLLVKFGDIMVDEWNKDCEDMFEDKELFDYIKSNKFDIAIMDPLNYPCSYAYTYKLGVPVVTFSVPFAYIAYKVPMLPSQTPNVGAELTDIMSFSERLYNFWMCILDNELSMNTTEYYVRKYVPEKPAKTATDLIYDSAMWFYLHDGVITYPHPLMPNTIDIGDIMIRKAKPLSNEFNQLMDQATDRVVMVSLGSYFNHAPHEWLDTLCRAFQQIEYTLIWKSTQTPPCELPSNVKVFKWIPQNDLLAHPKMALFISHCGINSLIESLGHGVPVLGFPIGIDQPHNAFAVKHRGYGKILNIFNVTSAEIVDNVYQILNDPTYRERTHRAGELMRHRPMSAGKRASFWIDHIVKFGADHLRTQSDHLSFWQYLMVDIFLLIVGIILTVIIVVVFICCLCFRMCKRCLKKSKGKKSKKE